MDYVKYTLTNDEYIPAIIKLGDKTTKVWRQNRWDTGEFFTYIQKNGCGHCCSAMAATLHGVDITPYEEYMYCRERWGAPQEHQYHYMSVPGITKILNSLNVPASYYGVPADELDKVEEHIATVLKEGKQVIFWSQPSDEFPENPFSKGEHYVFAVGYDEDGHIIVANSSEKWTSEGIQKVDAHTIARALRKGCKPTDDKTWAEPGHHDNCAGYIVVG